MIIYFTAILCVIVVKLAYEFRKYTFKRDQELAIVLNIGDTYGHHYLTVVETLMMEEDLHHETKCSLYDALESLETALADNQELTELVKTANLEHKRMKDQRDDADSKNARLKGLLYKATTNLYGAHYIDGKTRLFRAKDLVEATTKAKKHPYFSHILVVPE